MLIVRHQRAAFEGIEHLGSVKAQHGKIAPVADRHSVFPDPEYVCSIVKELQAVGIGNLLQLLVAARIAVDMDRHKRSGPRCNQAFDLRRVHSEGLRFDVAEYRRAVVPVNRVGGRNKGERRRNHFTGDPQRLHTHLQGDHAVGEQTDIFHSEIFRQLRLEFLVKFSIVGQPFICPDLFQAGDKFLQRRQGRFCHINRFTHRL